MSEGNHPDLRVVPADEAPWEDVATIFGARGGAARCQCQRYKLARGESFGRVPVEVRASRLREQVEGDGSTSRTSGLVAYLDDEPAGWCALEPRPVYDGLVRNSNRVAWLERTEDRTDATIWALTCMFTRAGCRRRGVSRALVSAAVEHARACGARALEAYPITTTDVILDELHVGLHQVFVDAGFVEVLRPTPRRTVVRVDFSGTCAP